MTKKNFLMGIIIIGIIDVFVIAGIYYAFRNSSNASEQIPSGSGNSLTIIDAGGEAPEMSEGDDSADDPINEVDLESLKNEDDPSESFISIYSTILPGKYVENEEVSFEFGRDGSYSGYFNKEHKYVEGYTYEIMRESDTENSVVLRSPNGTSERKFILGLNSQGSILLIEDGEDHALLFTLVSDGKAYRGEQPAESEAEESEGEVEETDGEGAAEIIDE